MATRFITLLTFFFIGTGVLTPAQAATNNFAYKCEEDGVSFYAGLNVSYPSGIDPSNLAIILDGEEFAFMDDLNVAEFALEDVPTANFRFPSGTLPGEVESRAWVKVTIPNSAIDFSLDTDGDPPPGHTLRTRSENGGFSFINMFPVTSWQFFLDCEDEDNTPPVVLADVNHSVLWWFNYGMKNVGLDFVVEDDQDPEPQVDILVYSDEPEDYFGCGWFTPDVQLTETGTLELRAERSWWEDGRVYLIVVVATDAAGNQGFDCVTVGVPRSWWSCDVWDLYDQMLEAEDVCLETLNPPEHFELLFSTIPE